MCVYVSRCESLANDSLETIEVIIVNLGMVTASDMGMRNILIIMTLTFIQGHADLNHENNKCLIISETIQAIPIKFAGKTVRLKAYINIASPMTLLFTQGPNCASNLTFF